jgi:HipA-like kinase
VSVATALRRVAATRYATALREGGSLPGLVEADDDGLYVVKFTGAGQGPAALVSEVVVGELARALGLLVPELVVVEVDPALVRAEPDPEIRELVQASAGPNLGVDFLPGALPFSAASGARPDPELAADVVWLDALTANVDRTPRNPNLLLWHDRMWLIDHGAALFLRTGGIDPAEHVLLPYAGSIAEADERLAPRVGQALREDVARLVPEAWAPASSPADYLARRLQAPRGFVEEAERARARL